MQLKNKSPKRTGAFTLVEMIGVLAIIAILTALLIPKIFQVINDAKISNALVSYNSVKAATAAHYGKWGGFRTATGTAYVAADYPVSDWDQILITGGYLETPFAVKVGNGLQGDASEDGTVDPATDGSSIRIVDISGLDSTTDVVIAGDGATGGTYRLAASVAAGTGLSTAPIVDVTGSYLVEAVIPGVSLQDAIELNRRIDGDGGGFGQQAWSSDGAAASDITADFTGRVKWQQGASGDVTVYMYLAHR